MTAKLKILVNIAVLIVASWIILLVSAFLVFEVVVPFSAPPGVDFAVKVAYDTLKAVFGTAIFGIWFYSFYVIRDAYARITGLNETPSSSSSHQTHDENRRA